jgi:putative membrane protein
MREAYQVTIIPMILSLIAGIILGAVSVIFALENVTTVTVTLLHWQASAPLAVVLLGSMLCGVIVTLLILLPSVIRDELYLSAIKRQKKEAEDELARHRAAHANTTVESAAI